MSTYVGPRQNSKDSLAGRLSKFRRGSQFIVISDVAKAIYCGEIGSITVNETELVIVLSWCGKLKRRANFWSNHTGLKYTLKRSSFVVDVECKELTTLIGSNGTSYTIVASPILRPDQLGPF